MNSENKIIGKKIIGGLAPADNCRVRELEQKAIKFIKTIAQEYQPLFLAYSGGKDSEVLMHLAQKAEIEFTPFYNNTTVDTPGTLSYIKKKDNVMIIQPRQNFFQLIEHRGLPSPFQRFCCAKLKERFVARFVMVGVRREESQRRRQRYIEPQQCFIYKTGQRGQNFMPILYWTKKDIEDYVKMEGITLHPKYYDTDGTLHVERRVGCMACPLRGDRGLAEFKKWPKLVRAWCRALAIYRNTRTSLTKSVAYFNDEYENFYHNLYHRKLEELYEKRKRGFNAREELMKTFQIELPPPQSSLQEIKKRIESNKAL